MLQPEACNFIKKEALAKVFCEIFESSYFIELLQRTSFHIKKVCNTTTEKKKQKMQTGTIKANKNIAE